jgi:parvulin-like peptidyl-prolyl isomerase
MFAIIALSVAALVGLTVGCGGDQPDTTTTVSADLPNNAVAKVGELLITDQEFTGQLAAAAAQQQLSEENDPEGYEQLKAELLDSMVQTRLAVQKAESLGLSVTDQEVQDRFDSTVQNSFGGDQAALEEELASFGITLDDLRQQYREVLLTMKVYDRITGGITTIPEEEVTAYYEENLASYNIAQSDANRQVRHILIAPEAGGATEADWAAARAIASRVRVKLVNGGSWDDLASQYSDDPYTKDSGGALGAVYLGDTVAAFEEAAFSLGLNEISQPVRTTYGYHVLQVTAITDAGQQSLAQAWDQIVATLLPGAKWELWTQWVDDAKAELGVIYRGDMEPTTTTTESTDTSAQASTTTGATSTTAP